MVISSENVRHVCIVSVRRGTDDAGHADQIGHRRTYEDGSHNPTRYLQLRRKTDPRNVRLRGSRRHWCPRQQVQATNIDC